jgi:hypothetical protein
MHLTYTMANSKETSAWWKPRPVSKPHTARTFQIRPVSIDQGFELSCEGLIEASVPHRRLIDAIVQAVQMGRDFTGSIHIFDGEGKVAEVLPLPDRPHDVRDSWA